MPFGAALRSTGFRRLLIGQAVSSLGDWVATLAFIAAAFALSGGNQTAVGLVLVLRLVPPIFAAPVGGVVADRWSRRSIMVACDLARAALIAVVPFANIALLYVIAFVHECISLFFLPARDSSVPDLVPEGSREQANGLILASSYGSIPIAAALFGGLRLLGSNLPSWVPFVDVFSDRPLAFAFLFDSATFLFSAAMIATLQLDRQRRPQRVELFRDTVEGFRYVVREPTLRSLAYGLIVSMFGGGVLFAVGIGYVRQTLGGNDVAFGWLAALWGLGMGVGLLAVRTLIRNRGRAGVFVAAVAACGGVLLFMALVPILWLAFIAAVIFGMVFSVAVVVALTMAQETAEEGLRGRMMGGVQMLFRLGLGVGALGIGALAHSVGRLTGLVTLDGNQVGLLAGGALILLGSAAASGVLRAPHT
ncbi:MAG TPA: MFS transporter [Actinomycetota bacterium]|nr:MFS transporter [Actinomycetota bacterium]